MKLRASGFGFDHVFRAVNKVVASPNLAKQCYPSISQCIATLVANTSERRRTPAVAKLVEQAKSDEVKLQVLALLSLGEAGRRMSLSEYEEVDPVVRAAFDAKQEEVKSAASFALGSIAVGSLSKYLPLLLSDISAGENQYLLLQSLREVIARMSSGSEASQLAEHTASVLELLCKHATAEKDSVRNVVAECLGRLTALQPGTMVEQLLAMAKSDSAHEKCTVVTALKFAISDRPREVDSILAPKMQEFFGLLHDGDLVRGQGQPQQQQELTTYTEGAPRRAAHVHVHGAQQAHSPPVAAARARAGRL